MLLNGRERLVLLNVVLPPEGSLSTMKLVHDVRQQLALTEADFKAMKVTDPAHIPFDDLEDLAEKEIEFGTILKGDVATILTKLSKDGKITTQHVSICEKFGVVE